jgi:hypothetical protein
MENRGWVDRKINSNIAAFLHKVFASRRDFYLPPPGSNLVSLELVAIAQD